MIAIVEYLSNEATDLIRVVWMEIAIASFAVMMYYTLSGYVVQPRKGSKKLDFSEGNGKQPKASSAPVAKPAIQQPTTHQKIAAALRQGKLSEAIAFTKDLLGDDTAYAPPNVAPRLLLAAAKASNFEEIMEQMKALSGKFEARALEGAVLDAVRNQDTAAVHQLQTMSRVMAIPKSAGSLKAFAEAYSSDLVALRSIVEETEAPFAKSFAKAVLEACIAMKETDLAADVFEKINSQDAHCLRYIVESGTAQAPKKEAPIQAKKDSSNPSNAPFAIRASGKNGDLLNAIKIFEKQLCRSSLLYNSIIDACIECDQQEKAVEYFNDAKKLGFDDTVSYNTMMKGYIGNGEEDKAASLLAELKQKEGASATHGSYHGLLHARVTARDAAGAWKLVHEMQGAGVTPNSVTCSILLKGTVATPSDLSRVIALVNAMEKPMDEVLFSALVDACVRMKRMDILSEQMVHCKFQSSDIALSASTYGSMIKAFGQTRDINRVREIWTNMESHKVQPTSITLGCMVEALVSNGAHADAWKLVEKVKSDEDTKDLVNTVIYSTILKGFAKVKETGKVMAIYKEMQACGCMPNTITYNTMLNAFAQGGAMHRVPALLDDMKAANPPIEADVVTYSTIVKGFCNAGSLDQALKVFKDMQSEGKHMPDEVMYNSLLDGCARGQRPEDALKLLEDMKKTGVAPSNYTLSVLAKLMGRCRRLTQAFTLIEDLSREFGLKVNIQVYTCLIQACFMNRQGMRALGVHDKMLSEGLCPDEMTYSSLVKGMLQSGLVDKAVELTKIAYGIGSNSGNAPGIGAQLQELCATLGPKAAEALMAELPAISPGKGSSKGQGKGSSKGKGKGSCKGSFPAREAAPWKRQ